MKFKPSYTSSIAEDIMAERLIRAQAVEFLADAPMRLKSGLISPVQTFFAPGSLARYRRNDGKSC